MDFPFIYLVLRVESNLDFRIWTLLPVLVIFFHSSSTPTDFLACIRHTIHLYHHGLPLLDSKEKGDFPSTGLGTHQKPARRRRRLFAEKQRKTVRGQDENPIQFNEDPESQALGIKP